MANANAVGGGLALGRAASFLASLNASVQVRTLGQRIEGSHAVAGTLQIGNSAQQGALGAGIAAGQRQRAGDREVQTDLVFLRLCLLYTSPSPRDGLLSRMPSSA